MPANITFPGGELSNYRILVLRMKCKLRRTETSYIALSRGMFIQGPRSKFLSGGGGGGGGLKTNA